MANDMRTRIEIGKVFNERITDDHDIGVFHYHRYPSDAVSLEAPLNADQL